MDTFTKVHISSIKTVQFSFSHFNSYHYGIYSFLSSSIFRTRIKELTPSLEPTSRLPRSTNFRNKKHILNQKPNVQSPALSSSDSSRNSSPGMNQQNRLNGTNGSPSLRRSLLLAAKAPQVPPSPSVYRRSTLTQPTAASAAKSAKGPMKATPLPRVATIKPTVRGVPITVSHTQVYIILFKHTV